MNESSANAGGDSELVLGTVLASKYRLDSRLGEGGMGVVFAGKHLELGTRVAIKTLRAGLLKDETARARFLREARLAASIEGEHSTRIFDVGADEADRPFIVMEYLAGEGVDAKLAREGRLPVDAAATILVHLLDALAEAHARGLVHRDLKPANLFLVRRPGEPIWVKVLDFGISRLTQSEIAVRASSVSAAERDHRTLTEPRTLLGSPAYMSPEQLRDSGVDARADIWACGVILFELLSGRVPFEGATPADLYAQIISAPAPSLAAAGAGSIPGAVSRAVERCLAKSSKDRPQSAYELATLIAPFAHESARALVPRIRAWCNADRIEAPSVRGSRRIAQAAVGLTIVAAAGLAAFVLASIRAESTTPRRAFESAAAGSGAFSAEASSEALSLAPLVPSADASISAPAVASAAAKAGSAAPQPPASASAKAPPRRPTKAEPRRIQDLDGIEPIQ